MRLICLAAALLPGAAQADSLCGVVSEAEVIARLEGLWTGGVTVSAVSETLSVTETDDTGPHWLRADGGFVTYIMARWTDAPVMLGLAEIPIYDVDDVDDLLETTDTTGFADDLSDTPCGPEDLPQLTGSFAAPLEVGGEVTGTATLVAYFEDRILMLVEAEMRGDWGLAFITATALLVPEAE